jgi:hypothetical protein
METKAYFLTAASLDELAANITNLKPDYETLLSTNAGFDPVNKIFYVLVTANKQQD